MKSESSLVASPLSSSTVPRGIACAQCRAVRKKCDAVKPRCGRCTERDLACCSQILKPRRRRIEILEQKTMDLEAKFVSLSGSKNQDLLWQSLMDKVLSLDISERRSTPGKLSVVPLFPQSRLPSSMCFIQAIGPASNDQLELEQSRTISRTVLDSLFARWDPSRPLPHELSIYLIRLFLPYAIQCHFYMDLEYLIQLLARPPNDPLSIHPCLMNAMYTGACALTGGSFLSLVPFFLQQTQIHLHNSLEHADRLTHFLWASCIIGTCHLCKGRLTEAYVTITTCAQFALACGLDEVCAGYSMGVPEYPLLPAPSSAEEAKDRINLSHAVYMLDRSLAMICGFPSVFVTSAADTLAVGSVVDDLLATPKEGAVQPAPDLEELLSSDTPWKVKAMLLYERVERIAFEIQHHGHSPRTTAQSKVLSVALSYLRDNLPPLVSIPTPSTPGFDQSEPLSGAYQDGSVINPHLINAHVTCRGGILLLNSLGREDDREARDRAFDAARSLAELCGQIRQSGGLQSSRGYVVPMIHMQNAVRVFSRYVRLSEGAKRDPRFTECCKSLVMLVDFFRDAMTVYAPWAHIVRIFRDVLPLQSPELTNSSVVSAGSSPKSDSTGATSPSGGSDYR